MALSKKDKDAMAEKLAEMDDDEREALIELLGVSKGDGDVMEQIKALTNRLTALETKGTPPAPEPKKSRWSIFD